MSVSQESVDKIKAFSEKRQKAEAEYDKQPLSSSSIQSYNRRLDETLRELQDQVERQEDELRKLRQSNSIDFSRIDADPWSRVSQVQRAKKAYDSLLQENSELPDPGSALPSLLAVEEVSRLVKESKLSVKITADKLATDRQRVKAEEANLDDARLIQSELEKRIERARREKSKEKEKSPAQLAQEQIEQQREKNNELAKTIGNLKDSLHKFIDDTLAPMLAAEELGGPNVGGVMDISDTVLEAGYTRHGKPKKPKTSNMEENDGTQRHIDEIFRRHQPEQQQRRPANRKETAAAEMHELLDALLEAGSSYIDLPRESAASRFLVNNKVAQFHPRDARRLRLIDFGRSLDD